MAKRIQKVFSGGNKFDSKLEKFFYDQAKRSGLTFDFQKEYILIPAFKYNKESVRKMTLTVDFDFTGHGIFAIVDTKGFWRNDNKIKWKLLKHIFNTNGNTPEIFFPKNQRQCLDVIDKLLKLSK